MFQIVKSFLKFLWLSKNEHGIHSPFVFDLVTKCLYDKKKYAEYQVIRKYRKLLLANKNFIKVKDFGAGSKVFNSNNRQIGQIAKTAGISQKRAKLLFRVCQYFKPENILEIGTSLGMATISMSIGNKNAKITSLEGCEAIIQIAANSLQTTDDRWQRPDGRKVELIYTEFSKYFSTLDFRLSTFDLIYFDGNHSKEATLKYFNWLLPTINNNTVWIFDDIHWSQDMELAWQTIKKHPKVKVTIDTFQWGFVFFRSEQDKEHFVVRI